MKYQELKNEIIGSNLDERIKTVVCQDDVSKEKERYILLLDEAYKKYHDGDYHIISASGRSEISGNHTDHQHGSVIAASVNVDTLAVCKTNDNNIVSFTSLGYAIKDVDLSDLSVNEKEFETSEALIRGIAARFKELGYVVGGYDALSNTKVLVGSGISSSASFEVLVAEIFNHLYNDGKISHIEIAKIAQYAENVYFNKPCGLLDQMAISVGGFAYMDFKDPKDPKVESLNFDFKKYGYYLVLVDTKGSHEGLALEYGAMPEEMKLVAKSMGHDFLRECNYQEFIKDIARIRKEVNNDRAILRAYHFFHEQKTVEELYEALKAQDIKQVLHLMNMSGDSSYKYLQNVYNCHTPLSQSIPVALALSKEILAEDGACRVHGGGIEGTIQAIVPEKKLESYLYALRSLYGEDAANVYSIRPVGGYKII